MTSRGEKAGRNYLDFFWKGSQELLTLASQKENKSLVGQIFGGRLFFEIMK
jgi:hypothetical protein